MAAFIHFLILLGGIQGILFGAIHILRRVPPTWGVYLGWALFIHAFSDVYLWLYWTRTPIDLKLLRLFPLNVVLLPVYFLFRYINEATQAGVTAQRMGRWLGLAAMVELIAYLIPLGAALYTGSLTPPVLAFTARIRDVLSVASIPCFTVTIYSLIQTLRRRRAETPPRLINWLYQLVGGVCAVYGMALLPLFVHGLLGLRGRVYYYPLGLTSSLFLVWAGLRAFALHDWLRSQSPVRLPAEVVPPTQHLLFQQAIELLEAEQLYKKPALKLADVAGRLSISPPYLSRILNQQAGKNFTDLINEYRVREVQRLMNDPAFAQYTLEGLGLEAGFGAKSTYQAAFKRLTGQTPSQYRAQPRPVS